MAEPTRGAGAVTVACAPATVAGSSNGSPAHARPADGMGTPYDGRPPRAFWRTGVAATAPRGIADLWAPKFRLNRRHRFATAGSCFAQHIGRELRDRGLRWVEAEPAFPLAFPLAIPEATAQRFGYRLFSFRTGNIYTAALLRQWLEWAVASVEPDTGRRRGREGVARRNARDAGFATREDGRIVDLCRPAVEPNGYRSLAEAQAARHASLRAMASAISVTDVFVFTLGLTEAWHDAEDGFVFPVCPGTVAGRFSPERHVFRNARYDAVAADLTAAIALMRRLRPRLRVILTVSPVPLTATAGEEHVLAATTYSKSVLRAVAGDVAADDGLIDYFPSFEIVAGHWSNARFYEANLRSVTADGVAAVMDTFFGAFDTNAATQTASTMPREPLPKREGVRARQTKRDRAAALLKHRDLVCEEALLDALDTHPDEAR